MGGIAAGVGILGSVMSAGSTLMSAGSQASALRAQAPNDYLAAAYEAQQAKWNADESRAASQRKAMAIGQQEDAVRSKLQANAAMGGGDTTDSGVQALDAGIIRKGEYQQLMEMYAGESRARGWEDQSRNLLIGGINKSNADNYKASTLESQAPISAAGTLMSGAAGAFDKYGDKAWSKIKAWSEG